MVPLFPLPNVVLFPRVFLPLHIFEPRYREMVRDALAADRIIGMVLLRSGGAAGGADNPAVFPTGCAGRITHCEQLPDGRYNIVLRGVHKFRILEEDRTRSYRRASVETLDEPDEESGLREGRRRLERLLTSTGIEPEAAGRHGRRRPGERAVAVPRIRPDRESRPCWSATARSTAAGPWATCWRCSRSPAAISASPRRSNRAGLRASASRSRPCALRVDCPLLQFLFVKAARPAAP